MSELNESKAPEIGRRDFLSKGGRFAVATPAAVTMLLSTSLATEAVAKSGGGGRHKKRKKVKKLKKLKSQN